MDLLFFKQTTASEMRIRDWSSDVCCSDLGRRHREADPGRGAGARKDEAVDADQVAVHVDQGAAGIARIDRRVGLDIGRGRVARRIRRPVERTPEARSVGKEYITTSRSRG